MKVELNDNEVTVMTLQEVIDRLRADEAIGDMIDIDDGDEIIDITLDCGTDLCLLIQQENGSTYERTIDTTDIREYYDYEYCTWAWNEDGNNVLLCFD
jgi:hypothetical protein